MTGASGVQVVPFHHAGSGTWSYLVADGETAVAAVIDPVLDFEAASGRTSATLAQALIDEAEARGWRIVWLLETHAHADHLSAAHWLRERLPEACVAVGADIVTVQKTFREVFNLGEPFATDGSQFDRLLGDGERLPLGALQIEVIAVPGHTPDSVAFHIDDALFVGDSVSLPDSGTARCDFPGGDAGQLYRSIRRLFALPGPTRVFVCHDHDTGERPPRCQSDIATQRRENIHVRDGIDEAEFVAMRKARDAALAMPALILPSIQINIRGGALPEPENNGVRYLKLPLNQF